LEEETGSQSLVLIEKDEQGRIHRKENIPVRFVPFLGNKGKPSK